MKIEFRAGAVAATAAALYWRFPDVDALDAAGCWMGAVAVAAVLAELSRRRRRAAARVVLLLAFFGLVVAASLFAPAVVLFGLELSRDDFAHAAEAAALFAAGRHARRFSGVELVKQP